MKSAMKKPSSSSAPSSTAPAAPVARKHTVEEFLKELKENGAKEGPVAKKRPEKSSWMPDFRNYHPPVEDAVSIPSSSRVSTPGSTSSGTFVPVPEDAQTHQMIQNILSLVGDEKYQHFANYMAALMKDAESHGRNVNLLVSQSIALFRNQELDASNPP